MPKEFNPYVDWTVERYIRYINLCCRGNHRVVVTECGTTSYKLGKTLSHAEAIDAITEEPELIKNGLALERATLLNIRLASQGRFYSTAEPTIDEIGDFMEDE